MEMYKSQKWSFLLFTQKRIFTIVLMFPLSLSLSLSLCVPGQMWNVIWMANRHLQFSSMWWLYPQQLGNWDQLHFSLSLNQFIPLLSFLSKGKRKKARNRMMSKCINTPLKLGQLQIDPYNFNLKKKKKKNPHQIKLYAWLKFWSLSEIIFKMKRERKKKK